MLLNACGNGPTQEATKQPTAAAALTHATEVPAVYYDYGGPPELYFHKAQIAVLNRYGVRYSGFGCVITDSIVQATTRHNDSLFARLAVLHPGFNAERLQHEIQDFAANQKAIETTIDPYLKKKIRHYIDSPYYYPDVVWRALDTPAKTFYVSVFLEEYVHGTRQGPVLEMKVTPATGDMLVKGSDGAWNECMK